MFNWFSFNEYFDFILVLLTPILIFFHWKKLSNLGYITWKFLLDMLEIIVEWFKQIIKYICEIMVSFFPMYVYIILVNKILLCAQIKLTFWIDLLILMLYQYMLLKLFSNIIKWIIMFITKKIHKLQCFEKYVKGEIIYLIFKNCTYLSMVFVYAAAVGRDKSGMPLAAAIGVLSLVDTFLLRKKRYKKK